MRNVNNKWLTFSVITAVLISLLDIAELFTKPKVGMCGIHEISIEMVVIMAFAFIVYWLLCLCVLMPVIRFSKLDSTNLDVGLAVFLVIAHIFYILHRYVKFGHFLSDLRLAVLVIAVLIISLLMSAIIISHLKRLQQKTWMKHLQKLGLFMSFIFIVVVLAVSFITNYDRLYDRMFDKQVKQAVRLPGAPKHVIFILIDTLRADAISCINPDTMATPNIDALADDGLLFNNARSTSPWTIPSLSSIFTGLSPLAHRVITKKLKLPDECVTIAEYFDRQNYQTAGFSQNYMIFNKNFEQGFDIFEHQWMPGKVLLYQKILQKFRTDKVRMSVGPQWATNQAIKWIDSNFQRHGFLYIHYLDPHSPYEPIDYYLPKENIPERIGKSFKDLDLIASGDLILSRSEKSWVRKLYEAETANIDKHIGTIISDLKKKGIYEQALIVFTSDHGEEFWEHGKAGHGQSLFNELLHVPLIIKMPSQTVKRIIDSRVTVDSIIPTVLDICRIEYDPKTISAVSLAPAITNNTKIPPMNVVSTGCIYYENSIAVEFDNFKYIERFNDGTQDLYDLKDDPHELINIANDNGDIISIAKKIIAEKQKNADALRQENNLKESQIGDIDEGSLEILRGLGYVN